MLQTRHETHYNNQSHLRLYTCSSTASFIFYLIYLMLEILKISPKTFPAHKHVHNIWVPFAQLFSWKQHCCKPLSWELILHITIPTCLARDTLSQLYLCCICSYIILSLSLCCFVKTFCTFSKTVFSTKLTCILIKFKCHLH